MSKRQTALIFGLILLVVGSPIAGMAGAVNTDASAAQNPEIEVDVTKASHDMGWSPTQYESDSGELTELNASVNETKDNPYSYALDGVNATDFGAFPHAKSGVSALDAAEWTKDVSGSAGTATIANVETEPGVDAVSLSTSGQTSGDTAVFTMSNFSVTSDAEKRMLQLGMNINTLETGATVDVRAVDADGDYVSATANPSQTGGEEEIASATGDGYMFQRQIGKMAVAGTGDGTMGEVQKVEVHVTDANADVDLYALNSDKFSKYDFGTERYDSDNDGELDDTRTIREVNGSSAGAISVESLDTLGSTFDSATLHDVTAPMLFTAAELSGDDVSEEYSDATNYPNFDKRADIYYRFSLPDQYDLSYANAELTDTVELPGSRYQTVEYAEGVGDTDYENISSFSAITSNYDSVDADVTVDSTVTVGTNMVIHYDYVITQSEYEQLISETVESAGGGVLGGGSGGIVSMIFSLPGAIVAGVLGLIGIRSFGG